jgi:hypothetical protein
VVKLPVCEAQRRDWPRHRRRCTTRLPDQADGIAVASVSSELAAASLGQNVGDSGYSPCLSRASTEAEAWSPRMQTPAEPAGRASPQCRSLQPL